MYYNVSKLNRLLVLMTALWVVSAGCARTPSGLATASGPELVISMTVAGQISPSDYYFVLFNNTNVSGQIGPVPVIAPPWGNGFAGGQFTSFVRYDPSQPTSEFGIYSVVPNSNQLQFTYLGSPAQYTPVQTNTNTLQFTIPLSLLGTAAVPAADITSLQINFLNTNYIPIDPNYSGTKLFDALGDGRVTSQINSPITIPTTQSALFDNSQSVTPEPEGDVMLVGNGVYQNQEDPNLDIIDWSVEVRT